MILAQQKLETSRQKGVVHSVEDCNARWDRTGATLRGVTESTRQHLTEPTPTAPG